MQNTITLENLITSQRVRVPDQREELAILTEAARALGPLSYCGPWLEQQIDGIARDMRSDHFPQIDLDATKAQCAREAARCAAECAARLASAEKQAAALLSSARGEAADLRGRVAAACRQAEKIICG